MRVLRMSDKADGSSPSSAPSPTLLELFFGFARISISGFGGVLAWPRRLLVDEKRWMSPAEFNELYALCQFLPGANVVSLSVMFGARRHGAKGAVVAFLGLVGPGATLMLVVGTLYSHYGGLPHLSGMLAGLAAGAAGLIIGTAARMGEALPRQAPKAAHVNGAAPLIAIGTLYCLVARARAFL